MKSNTPTSLVARTSERFLSVERSTNVWLVSRLPVYIHSKGQGHSHANSEYMLCVSLFHISLTSPCTSCNTFKQVGSINIRSGLNSFESSHEWHVLSQAYFLYA